MVRRLRTAPAVVAAVYRAAVTDNLDAGLTMQQIWPDLVEEYGYRPSYESVEERCNQRSTLAYSILSVTLVAGARSRHYRQALPSQLPSTWSRYERRGPYKTNLTYGAEPCRDDSQTARMPR